MAWRNTVGTFMGIEKKGCIWAIIGRKSDPDSPEVVWLALGVSNLLCPFPPLPPPPFLSHCHHTHLKANSTFGEKRTHSQSHQQFVPGSATEGKWQQSYCKPKRPLMAEGTQLVKHNNCLNNFQPLHAAIDNRKWGEILYFPTKASQAIQKAEMQFWTSVFG